MKGIILLLIFIGSWVFSSKYLLSKKQSKVITIGGGFLIACIVLSALGLIIFGKAENITQSHNENKTDDNAIKVASYLQDFLNRPENNGGKVKCEARRIGDNAVQCDLRYISGMTNLDVIVNTKGIAEMMGEIGIASTIYFTGWRGNLKVCEYKWDVYSRKVTQVK